MKSVVRNDNLEVCNTATDPVLVFHLGVLELVKYAILRCRSNCLNIPHTLHVTYKKPTD